MCGGPLRAPYEPATSPRPGSISQRHDGALHRIGIGRTQVLAMIQSLDIRIIDTTIGRILPDLILDLTRIYQPTGHPPGNAQRSLLIGRDLISS